MCNTDSFSKIKRYIYSWIRNFSILPKSSLFSIYALFQNYNFFGEKGSFKFRITLCKIGGYWRYSCHDS